MENTYDCIVIGAGNAGLIATLELVKKNKKVLLLESNLTPGGFATSFKRGRFEFEASLNQITDYGRKENPGKIYKLFEKLGLNEKIELETIPEAYHVYETESKENFKMPFGIDEYIEKMEEYVPGSYESIKNFFSLAIEVKDALAYIEESKGGINEEILNSEYENFMKVATHSVDKVLDALKMPKKAQEILTSYWIFLGSPTENLSFVEFATSLHTYISLGGQIPKKRSYEISILLAEEIEKNGGEIKYLSTVKEILFKDKKIAGVQLTNGEIYKANHIISSVSPTFVYGKWIPSPMLPKEALKLTNSRVLGAQGFAIYLGLNQTAEDLGLNDYTYIIHHSLNSNKEFQHRSSIKNSSSIAVVINNANPLCSPKGTCIINLISTFFGEAFEKNITEENYFELKDKIAEEIISTFENTTGIKIKPYIEEIEIATPVTFARYGGHPGGVIYGYKRTGLDNTLPRMLTMGKENYIKNLQFCGGFGVYASSYSSAYLSGDLAAKLTRRDIASEERNKEEDAWQS